MNRANVTVLGIVCLLAASLSGQGARPTKPQIEEINRQFKDRLITAKMDLPIVRSVYVTPSGEYDEARYRERLAMQPPSIPRDDTATLTKIEVEKDTIHVLINRGGMRPPHGKVLAVFGGRKARGARIEIEFHRPVSAADLTPETIVRAVSRIITIQGMDASVAMARPDELLAPVATSAPAAASGITATASAPASPDLQVFSAEVKPMRLRAGETLDLVVHYEVRGLAGNAQVAVIEERQLVFDGQPLFTQPVSETLQRGNGRHASSFAFKVPATAKPGIYTFTVTVRAAKTTAAKEALFQITP